MNLYEVGLQSDRLLGLYYPRLLSRGPVERTVSSGGKDIARDGAFRALLRMITSSGCSALAVGPYPPVAEGPGWGMVSCLGGWTGS